MFYSCFVGFLNMSLLLQVRVTADNVLAVAKNLSDLTDNMKIDDDNLQDISSIFTDIVAVNDPSLNVGVKNFISVISI